MKRIKIRKHACKTENKNRSNKKKKKKSMDIYIPHPSFNSR